MAAGEQEGREYLRRHRIPELLHRLGALLLYHRPERPREFLIQALERVKAGKRAEGEYPYLMDEANLVAMFQLLDVLGQGHITPGQYREALKTLGLSTEDVQFGEDEIITLDVFKEEVDITALGSGVADILVRDEDSFGFQMQWQGGYGKQDLCSLKPSQ